ncbi:transcriptional regulator domain-containing protein [Oscillochloris trichoides DG-6]|uniref:Transcriptional regulator domain-containing protein n=1 Tax=Oscillochloris trichoides DG-6 TaxID=765420 RepID=E1IAN5_9CHLR|nr:FHA domain-containing protein [Oscillochloris trichoides]EFO81809.1 transcriptional regulator domain-containing protein [Oscillochloris trichoides DG-6]
MSDLDIPFARLVGVSDDVAPNEFLLSGQEHSLGRSALCDVVIPRHNISRLHARIVRAGPRYMLHDAGSANGTFVNGQMITAPHLLANRDGIGLGAAGEVVRFLDPDPTIVTTSRLRFDERTQTFLLGNQALNLPPNQFRLLSLLYRQTGNLCTREACAEAVWGRDYDPGMDAEALDKAVSGLRAALRRLDTGADKLLQTRRGMGYVLMLSSDAE